VAADADDRSLRLFVAVELPREVREALAAAVDTLRRAGVDDGLRWVRPEGIHVTLKFLGATPPARVPQIGEALRRALAGAAAFALQPESVGTFPGGRAAHARGDVRVVWVGVAGDTAALGDAAARVERALAPLGYPTERRPFAAHLTLARVREEASREMRERILRALEPYAAGAADPARLRFPSFEARAVSLMQSTLRPGGAEYRALETVALEG
jgi:2'-5' RNA ligase